jgi:hypothetical protein
MVQDWKRRRYGDDDCEDIEVILESMTSDELQYGSPAAKLEYLQWNKGRTYYKYKPTP